MKIENDKTLTNKWVKQPNWFGNPELGLDCFGKKYPDGTKVYIFGLENKHKEPYEISDYMFIVRHSRTGCFKSDSSTKELMNYVDLRYKLGLLDSGRELTETELNMLVKQSHV